MLRKLGLAVAVVSLLATGHSAVAQSVDHPRYLKAYFLEHEDREFERAEALYREVAEDARLSEAVRREATVRADSCHEEVVSRDLARLMRPETLLYAELHAPGEQLERLAGQLGLLRDRHSAATDVGVSPVIFDELFGLRGLAISVTGFDPTRGAPSGLVVIHPGNIEIVRGLLETALPVAARPVDPVEGFATFCIEDQAYVTLTHRLIFASTSPASIRSGIQQLRGTQPNSLASSGHLDHALADRDGTLLSFGVNLERVMPLVTPLMMMGARRNPEIAMLPGLLDLPKWKSLSGRIGLSEAGAALEARFEMLEGHRNIVFNLGYMPPFDRATLARVPAGCGAVLGFSLNPRSTTVAPESSEELPPVALFDLGREIFGNLIGVAAYVTDPLQSYGGEMLPSVGLVVTSNDPLKTESIWRQLLGVASVGARRGQGTLTGDSVEVAGHPSFRFPLPEGIELYLARVGQEITLATSEAALVRALTLHGDGADESVLSDAAFAQPIAALDPATKGFALVHPARLFSIVAHRMPERDLAQAQPFVDVCGKTVLSLESSHARNYAGFRLALWSIPKVGPVIFQQFGIGTPARDEGSEAPRPRRRF